MKTLVLSDETYERLRRFPTAARLLADEEPELPDAEELHRIARAKQVPEAFNLTRSRMEAISDAGDAMRGRMHELIRIAHARGVGPAWLARWSGYDPSHVYAILDPKTTATDRHPRPATSDTAKGGQAQRPTA